MQKRKGFTLIEALIFSMIFVVVATSFYRTFSSGLVVLRDSKAKIAAAQLANERFEILRNVPYELLGTQGGSPSGDIISETTAQRSGTTFAITTNIHYVDDIYDGVCADADNDGTCDSGGDDRPNDYKHIEVIVEWGSGSNSKLEKFETRVAPPGTEELYTGGILNVDIRQSDGVPVQGANVVIKNINTMTNVHNGITGADGKVYLIGQTAGERIYQIAVTAGDYESVTTMAPYGPSQLLYDPVDQHASVVQAGIWSQTILFDRFADTTLRTIDPFGNPISDIAFSLEGGRKVGSTEPDDLPVYSYAKTNHTTNSSGELNLENHSPGRYIFEYASTGANTNYVFWKVDPVYNGNNTHFFAYPGILNTIGVILIPKNVPSLFLTVVDSVDDTPISNASVRLKNETLGYEETLITDQFGKVFFPDESGPLQNVSYEVLIQSSGYQDKTESVTISNLTESTIEITANL